MRRNLSETNGKRCRYGDRNHLGVDPECGCSPERSYLGSSRGFRNQLFPKRSQQEANFARCSIIGGSFRKTSQGCTSSQENERGIVTGSNGQKPKGAHHHAKR